MIRDLPSRESIDRAGPISRAFSEGGAGELWVVRRVGKVLGLQTESVTKLVCLATLSLFAVQKIA